jgi:hypothetical protein
MAQPPSKTAIPPAPSRGTNIHGQPNSQPSSTQDVTQTQQPLERVNIHGQPPQADMAPPEETQEGLGDNTKAEMAAGKANLKQYSKRDDAEHAAGRHANRARNPQGNPQGNN